jgi:hypothetical protein
VTDAPANRLEATMQAEIAALRREVAALRGDASALLDLLESVWAQFACEVRGRPGVRHDGGLSTLSDVQVALEAAGRLEPAGVPGKDWWTARRALPPPSPRNDVSKGTERSGA